VRIVPGPTPVRGLELYLGKKLRPEQVAFASASARRNGTRAVNENKVAVEVSVCVDNDEEDEDGGEGADDDSSVASSVASSTASSAASSAAAPNTSAQLHLVRIVNDGPMLDGPETPACAIAKLLPTMRCWKRFGLLVSGSAADDAYLPPHLPAFAVADADAG
jgi:hypothetical protein